MEVATVIRDARREAGLTQAALAHKSGTSQATLAHYESGRRMPRLDTLERVLGAAGYELILSVQPIVRRGAVPVAEVAGEVSAILRSDGERAAWRRLLDFVDDFRGSSRPGQRFLVADPPPLVGDARFDAAIAGIVELLCDEADLPGPAWTDEPERFVEPWWFVSGLAGYEAMALRDSPFELKRHGVFVSEGAFERV